jgi:hypothetical protein
VGDCLEHIVAEEAGQFDDLLNPKQMVTCCDALRCPETNTQELTQMCSDVLAHQVAYPA